MTNAKTGLRAMYVNIAGRKFILCLHFVISKLQHYRGLTLLFRKGSFGNATSKEGCRKCECNGHGDESLGLCDPDTGVCFCQHNTEGTECEKCKKGYYGDPKNGGICYFQVNLLYLSNF